MPHEDMICSEAAFANRVTEVGVLIEEDVRRCLEGLLCCNRRLPRHTLLCAVCHQQQVVVVVVVLHAHTASSRRPYVPGSRGLPTHRGHQPFWGSDRESCGAGYIGVQHTHLTIGL